MSFFAASPRGARFQAYLAANARSALNAVEIGPFAAQFDEGDANPFRNYATPVDDSARAPEAVRALVAEFQRRGRRPRLEYVEGVLPGLTPLLLGLGFQREPSPRLMAETSGQAAPPPPHGCTFELATAEDALEAAAQVQNAAYAAGPPGAADVARLARLVEGGGLVGLVRLRSGEAAASGLCTPPREGACELAAVGVLEPWRRHGLATAVTAGLLQAARRRGLGEIFLMAYAREQAVYERVGFRAVGVMAHLSWSTG